VHDLSKLVQGALGSAIRLSLKLSPQLWSVRADRGQLEQAFLNLVVNARDAMPMGGTLTISTANSRDGTGVLIRFTDTGVGMSAGTKARIFDPFFTTKAAGKGSGLGLSTVHGIIGQSGGKISVKSEPGHGAEFEIFLPRAEQIPAKPPKSAAANMEADAGTILLVEDQADLRAVLSRFLQDSEYRVLEAKDGDQAIRIANRFPTRIDVMVTDIVMPGLSGYDIAQKIREIRPGTKVVYLTGYLDAKKQLHRLQADERLLEKPVHPEKLLASVREMIAA
jgi:two-component system, cell cycle sensor histidine kinase and response regulator CckA